MATPLRVLMAEDSEDDALLIARVLREGGYEPTIERVETAEAFAKALDRQEWDVILADYTMPHFDGRDALQMVQARGMNVPFIVVSGTIGEDAAVALMKSGASDYVRKDNLARLVPVVQRELREAAERRARRRAEDDLEAAREHLLQVESEKKRFYREVIRAVTQGKLHLVEPGEIPTEGTPVLEMDLGDPAAYRALRERVEHLAVDAGMAPEDADDMVLATGEAAINAIKHAGGGKVTLYTAPGRVIARIVDHGPGIQADQIPATILLPGHSTTISLGMGFTIMLQLTDTVWLATGPEGTTIQLEKGTRHEVAGKRLPPPAWAEL